MKDQQSQDATKYGKNFNYAAVVYTLKGEHCWHMQYMINQLHKNHRQRQCKLS